MYFLDDLISKFKGLAIYIYIYITKHSDLDFSCSIIVVTFQPRNSSSFHFTLKTEKIKQIFKLNSNLLELKMPTYLSLRRRGSTVAPKKRMEAK